jgi:death-on-curing protein
VTTQEAIELHDHALRDYGGGLGIRDAAVLQSSLAQPTTAVFGEERYPTLHEKAAAYCFFIIRNHPFVDGNKRTGLLTALHFLLTNGRTPVFNKDEAYAVLTRVAAGDTDFETLSSLFERAIQPSANGGS